MTREPLDEIGVLFRKLENQTVRWALYVHDQHRDVWPKANEYEQSKLTAQHAIEHRLRVAEKANAERREEIRLLGEQVNVANQELLRRAEEITQLQHAYQQLADAHEMQYKEVVRLEEKLKGLCCTHGNAIMQMHNKDKEITRLQEIMSQFYKETTRLRELLRAGVLVAQMARSFDAEEYPIMVGEAIAFLDLLTQEPT